MKNGIKLTFHVSPKDLADFTFFPGESFDDKFAKLIALGLHTQKKRYPKVYDRPVPEPEIPDGERDENDDFFDAEIISNIKEIIIYTGWILD